MTFQQRGSTYWWEIRDGSLSLPFHPLTLFWLALIFLPPGNFCTFVFVSFTISFLKTLLFINLLHSNFHWKMTMVGIFMQIYLACRVQEYAIILDRFLCQLVKSICRLVTIITKEHSILQYHLKCHILYAWTYSHRSIFAPFVSLSKDWANVSFCFSWTKQNPKRIWANLRLNETVCVCKRAN